MNASICTHVVDCRKRARSKVFLEMLASIVTETTSK
jgi:hypothetical protein